MFNKLLSNLPYNPSLINTLDFYSRRLKQENSVRRLGLLLIAMSLFVQMFASAIPAEKSLASSTGNDVINNGVSSLDQLKGKCYDGNYSDVRALYSRFGLTCDQLDVASAQAHGADNVNVNFNFAEQGANGTRTVGRTNFSFTKDHYLGEFSGSKFYSRSAAEWQGSSPAYFFGKHQGTDNNYYYVWVLKDCGNIAYRLTDSPASTPTPTPTPTPAPTPVAVPETPSEVSCTGLVANNLTGVKSVPVQFTAAYSANKANLVNGITFDFGDGTVYRHNGVIIDHTYTNDTGQVKSFLATVTINSLVGDKTSPACQLTITVQPELCTANPNDPSCKKEVCLNNPALAPDDPKCTCPDNPSISADDPNCLILSQIKMATNMTQKLSNDKIGYKKSRGGDVIEFQLFTINKNIVDKTGYKISDNVADVLDYAKIDTEYLKQQGGSFDEKKKTVSFDNLTIPAQSSVMKSFRATIKSPVPSTNQPNATAPDYDCKIENSYGKSDVTIPINCPALKNIEKLPNTGPGESISIVFGATFLSSYFFARGRLFSKELSILKKEYSNTGF